MGQLRTSILSLQKLLVNNPAKLEAVQKALEAGGTRIEELGRTADEGWNLVFMHLTNKFKKSGGTAANANLKLSEVIDPELAKLIKGVDSWKKDMTAVAAKYEKSFSAGMAVISKDLSAAEAEAKKLRGVANKKLKKWLASAKYKAKIKGYLDVIDDIDGLIATQKKQMSETDGLAFDTSWVNKWFTVSASMTVKDFESRASMDTQAFVKNYLADQQKADKYVRKWRDEYKGMASQLATMKKWSDDADEMEEVENEDVASVRGESGDGSGALKAIKILSGSKEIGTADKGDYKPKAPLKLIVKWDKGVDPLSLLKKKVTIKAAFVDSGRGTFTSDFKVDKVLGDMKTITFS